MVVGNVFSREEGKVDFSRGGKVEFSSGSSKVDFSRGGSNGEVITFSTPKRREKCFVGKKLIQ